MISSARQSTSSSRSADLALDVQEAQQATQARCSALRRTDARASSFAQHERADGGSIKLRQRERAVCPFAIGEELACDVDVVAHGRPAQPASLDEIKPSIG
jgi:hypothetical protein